MQSAWPCAAHPIVAAQADVGQVCAHVIWRPASRAVCIPPEMSITTYAPALYRVMVCDGARVILPSCNHLGCFAWTHVNVWEGVAHGPSKCAVKGLRTSPELAICIFAPALEQAFSRSDDGALMI